MLTSTKQDIFTKQLLERKDGFRDIRFEEKLSKVKGGMFEYIVSHRGSNCVIRYQRQAD